MSDKMPLEHEKMILDALRMRNTCAQKLLNTKEVLVKAKDVSLESYKDYKAIKNKVNMVLDLVEMLKDE